MVPATTPPPSGESAGESYRAEILAVDAASLVLALSGNEMGIKVAGLTYLLGGPIIHGAHGGGGRAGASLVMRVGMPLLGALAGAALTQHDCSADDECDDEFPVGPIFGFGLGILSAMILDTALLAGPREAPKNTGTTWAPQVSVTPHHVGLGVVGRF
jgi:hypothetical protein